MHVDGVSLQRVVDELGTTLIELRAGQIAPGMVVGGSVIFEQGDDPGHVAGAIVLVVGLSGPESIPDLIRTLAEHGAAALVVRSELTCIPEVVVAARSSELPLLALRSGATWEQLTWMIRSLLAGPRAGIDSNHTVGGITAGDLFALANVISNSLDAPVTIEDREFNVLAFSGRQDEADESRIATILRRRVPLPLIRQLKQAGIVNTIYESNEPVHLSTTAAGGSLIEKQRVVVAVRAGSEVLGTIWVAVDRALDDGERQFLKDTARLAALHLLALRAGSDLTRSYLAENVSSALSGGNSAAEALARLHIRFPVAVVAVSTTASTDGPGESIDEKRIAMYRIADSFSTHLASSSPESVSAIINDTVYSLIPVSGTMGRSTESPERISRDFVKRVGNRTPMAIAIGPVAHNISELYMSKNEVDRTLRVIKATPESAGTVALWDDLAAKALLLDLYDIVAARGDRPSGPVARLRNYDKEHQNHLVSTLELWLEAGCDIQQAARAAFVHPNTFRYRLKRASEVSGIDLSDADDRFFAQLQLRLIRHGAL